MTRVLLLSIIAFTFVGCASTRYQYNDGAAPVEPVTDEQDAVVAYDLCTHGVQTIEARRTVSDLALTVVTLSLYSPNTVFIQCQEAPARGFFLDDADSAVVALPANAMAGDVL